MSRYWEYPVYVIPHGGGYASMVDSSSDDEPAQMLVIYTDSEVALEFMAQFNLPDTPRMLFNDRELGWLLRSVRAPVTEVVFDPCPTGERIDPRWRVSIRELLEEHLTADYSPWNYPVFAIAQTSGFVSIDATSQTGEALTALGLFTGEEHARAYLLGARESGELCRLENVDEARIFLTGLIDEVAAVALNPTVQDEQRSAKYCFSLQTLLDKYLVREV